MAKDQKNGNIVLVNQCNYDLYIWEAWEAYQSGPIKVPARSPFRKDIVSQYDLPKNRTCIDNCGVTYKVSKTQKLIGGKGGNQLQFEFATRAGLIYFDMSFVDCVKDLRYRSGDASNCPSWAEGIRIEGQKPPQQTYGCGSLECGPKDMCIHNGDGAYYVDEPKQKWNLQDPVKTCPTYKAGMELYFRTCTQNGDIPHRVSSLFA
ncbi:hypothetical protein P171DRAFT_495999 [Karstenula rhodostoma CBS 690.94]|uniref:Uncharacterized protein n=1 Tax=Karstenula rhodostoma CBS 690.94 TaxID=1392251 RepID=A0A9P4PD26_9PLEO|nr:hypothetical protein P171DRAFT_495999 [Karstenula rhodostoma CBS 690.94]